MAVKGVVDPSRMEFFRRRETNEMPIVAVFNNKGGEGKSTVTVGLAEFLAGNRDKKVLVIDLDAQASSTCALVGQTGPP